MKKQAQNKIKLEPGEIEIDFNKAGCYDIAMVNHSTGQVTVARDVYGYLEAATIGPGDLWLAAKQGAVYPQDAVRVVRCSTDSVDFVRVGYNSIMTGSLDDFLQDFRETTPPELISEYRPALFGFDDGPLVFGYTNGELWNGWGMPRIPVEIFADYVAKEVECFGEGASGLTMEDGCAVWFNEDYEDDEDDDGKMRVEATTITVDGKEVKVFNMNMGLCWNVYDLDAVVDYPDDTELHEAIRNAVVPEGFDINSLPGLSEEREE